MRLSILLISVCVTGSFALSGCETISEDACLAGSWEDIGFKDGEAGRSRSRLADIAESCAEYGVTPDRDAYFRGFETGLTRYCGPANGFEAGRDGRSPNAECEAGGFADYMSAYVEGNEIYQLVSERDDLVRQWEDRREAYLNVTERLTATDMDAKERRRLEKKAARLSNEMEDLKIDIRVLERLHDLPRWSAPTL